MPEKTKDVSPLFAFVWVAAMILFFSGLICVGVGIGGTIMLVPLFAGLALMGYGVWLFKKHYASWARPEAVKKMLRKLTARDVAADVSDRAMDSALDNLIDRVLSMIFR
jgi:hypothetical protein